MMPSVSLASLGRHRNSYPPKSTSPSDASLFSTHTASSGASAGSTSTVTPHILPRMRSRELRHTASRGAGKRAGSLHSRPKTRSQGREPTAFLNVFDFLDKDGLSRNASRLSLAKAESDPSTPIPEVGSFPSPINPLVYHEDDPDSDQDSAAQSLHSDSGISIRDSPEPRRPPEPLVTAESRPTSSPEGLGLAQMPRPRLRHVRSRRIYRPETRAAETATAEPSAPKVGDDSFDASYPESFYLRPSIVDAPDGRSSARASFQSSTAASVSGPEVGKTHNVQSGYDMLASRLASLPKSDEPKLPSLYRKFETLNHRILLQLQDEIAEMEEDLKALDASEAQCRVAAHGKANDTPLPASRRLDWQYSGFSALHSRRLDLLGRIYVKVEQYNQALCAFNKVSTMLAPAAPSDIDTYRKWMTANAPIAEPEAAFLGHATDLVNLDSGGNKAAPTHVVRRSVVYFAVAAAAVAVILPLLAFSAISEYFGRLVVVAIVGGAVSLFLGASRLGEMLGEKHVVICALGYFGLMSISALFAP